MVALKTCGKCKLERPVGCFSSDKNTKDGKAWSCRACRRAWRADHAAKAKVSNKAWREKNREYVKERTKARYQKNKEYAKEQARAWRKANPERAKQTHKAWRMSNQERIKKSNKAWAEANPEKIAVVQARRLLRERLAPGGSFKANIRAGLYNCRIEAYGGLCAYCKKAPYDSLEHAIPLSRGGSNHIYNIFPSCTDCNVGLGGKHTQILWLEWEPPCKDGWE